MWRCGGEHRYTVVSRPSAVRVVQKRCSCRYWIVMFVLALMWAAGATFSAWSFSKLQHCDDTRYNQDTKVYECVIVLDRF
jgi:hypothetical protein